MSNFCNVNTNQQFPQASFNPTEDRFVKFNMTNPLNDAEAVVIVAEPFYNDFLQEFKNRAKIEVRPDFTEKENSIYNDLSNIKTLYNSMKDVDPYCQQQFNEGIAMCREAIENQIISRKWITNREVAYYDLDKNSSMSDSIPIPPPKKQLPEAPNF